MQEKFAYSSQPHAAPVKRKTKYRDSDEDEGKINLTMMSDPRVIRGNTYGAKVLTTSMKREQEHQVGKVTQRLNSEAHSRKSRDTSGRATPPPVEGRSHMPIQTETFLEELTDKPIEADADTQTQPFMDRPISPLFVPTKTGVDTDTQIEQGDLFDFDLEVTPILEVLVGKTIHVSMLELMQEEELEAIRRDQEEFEAIRNIELAEVQRMEAESRRKREEKERRVAQERKRVLDRSLLEEKIAARAFSSQYLSSLHVNVINDLFEDGFFFDPVRKEAEDIFMVELMKSLKESVNSYCGAEALLEEILHEACVKAKEVQGKACELRAVRLKEQQEQEEREALLREEEQKRQAAAAAVAASADGDAAEEEA